MNYAAQQNPYPRMRRQALQVPEGWFAEGCNPWKDLYTPNLVSKLGKLASLKNDDLIDKLGVDVCAVAERFVTAADEVALEMTTTERKRWLDKNVIKPAKLLRNSFDLSNSPIWTEYPDSGDLNWLDNQDVPKNYDPKITEVEVDGRMRFVKADDAPPTPKSFRENWVERLDQMVEWAEETKIDIEKPAAHKLKPITAFKYDLVQELTLVYLMHASEPKTLAKDYSMKAPTPYVEFIREAVYPITGVRESLVEQIKDAKATVDDIEIFHPSYGVVLR